MFCLIFSARIIGERCCIGTAITDTLIISIVVYFFTSTFAKEYKSDDGTQMRGLRGREVISGRKLAKNWRKLVSIKGTVNLINSVRRGAPRITATAAKAVWGSRPPSPTPAKSGLNLIYTTHFLATGGNTYLRETRRDARGSRYTRSGVATANFRASPFHLSRPDVAEEKRSWFSRRGHVHPQHSDSP